MVRKGAAVIFFFSILIFANFYFLFQAPRAINTQPVKAATINHSVAHHETLWKRFGTRVKRLLAVGPQRDERPKEKTPVDNSLHCFFNQFEGNAPCPSFSSPSQRLFLRRPPRLSTSPSPSTALFVLAPIDPETGDTTTTRAFTSPHTAQSFSKSSFGSVSHSLFFLSLFFWKLSMLKLWGETLKAE